MGSVEEEEEGSVKVEGRRVVLFFLYAAFVYFSQKVLGGAKEEEGLKRRGEERDAVWQPVG